MASGRIRGSWRRVHIAMFGWAHRDYADFDKDTPERADEKEGIPRALARVISAIVCLSAPLCRGTDLLLCRAPIRNRLLSLGSWNLDADA